VLARWYPGCDDQAATDGRSGRCRGSRDRGPLAGARKLERALEARPGHGDGDVPARRRLCRGHACERREGQVSAPSSPPPPSRPQEAVGRADRVDDPMPPVALPFQRPPPQRRLGADGAGASLPALPVPRRDRFDGRQASCPGDPLLPADSLPLLPRHRRDGSNRRHGSRVLPAAAVRHPDDRQQRSVRAPGRADLPAASLPARLGRQERSGEGGDDRVPADSAVPARWQRHDEQWQWRLHRLRSVPTRAGRRSGQDFPSRLPRGRRRHVVARQFEPGLLDGRSGPARIERAMTFLSRPSDQLAHSSRARHPPAGPAPRPWVVDGGYTRTA
jgi:hypothetical protein